MNEHEVIEAREVFLGYEEDGAGGQLPTLYDPEYNGLPMDTKGKYRAVWLMGKRDNAIIIEVTTDPDVVAEFLE